jgi:hypothetical protein
VTFPHRKLIGKSTCEAIMVASNMAINKLTSQQNLALHKWDLSWLKALNNVFFSESMRELWNQEDFSRYYTQLLLLA